MGFKMTASSPIQVRKSIMTFLSTLKIKYQHIRYFPSAVRYGQAT